MNLTQSNSVILVKSWMNNGQKCICHDNTPTKTSFCHTTMTEKDCQRTGNVQKVRQTKQLAFAQKQNTTVPWRAQTNNKVHIAVSCCTPASSLLSIQFTLLLPVWWDIFPLRYKAHVMFRAFLRKCFMSLHLRLKHTCLFHVFLVLYLCFESR